MTTRSIFERSPRLRDLVPFVELADGLPTPVEQLADHLWVLRDDKTSSRYGGNKVRKLEFVLPLAQRRGGPVLTAGAIGSHHVLATTIHGHDLGLEVDAVRFPQPETPHVREVAAHLDQVGVDHESHVDESYAMPLGLVHRLAALLPKRPTVLLPGASSPLGILGYVSAGLELAQTCERRGVPEPDEVVVALGSGGTAVGLSFGLALAGWSRARVVGVRVADAIVTNGPVLAVQAGLTQPLLAMGGLFVRYRPVHVDTDWFGEGYGFPTDAGNAAIETGADMGLTLDPTYTGKAFAAALDRAAKGTNVLFVQTLGA